MGIKRLFFSIFVLCFILFSLVDVSSLSIAVHVPEKYTDVVAGERFYFEIAVKYPENPKRKDLRLEYEIRTIDGDLIAQSKTLKAIETQASFVDFIVIPSNAQAGLYIINIKIKDYENLAEEVSSSFNVIGGSSNQLEIYFWIILGSILFVGVLVIINTIRIK